MKMNKLKNIIVAATFAMAAQCGGGTPAYAQTYVPFERNVGFYVDGATGIVDNSNDTMTRKTTWGFKLGAGYDWDILRGAIEYNYMGNGSVVANIIGVQGYAEPYSFLVTDQKYRVTPYVTGGVGLGIFSGNGYGAPSGDTDTVFNFGAGVELQVTQNFSMYLEGRQYLSFGNHVIRDNGGQRNYQVKSLTLGLRYAF